MHAASIGAAPGFLAIWEGGAYGTASSVTDLIFLRGGYVGIGARFDGFQTAPTPATTLQVSGTASGSGSGATVLRGNATTWHDLVLFSDKRCAFVEHDEAEFLPVAARERWLLSRVNGLSLCAVGLPSAIGQDGLNSYLPKVREVFPGH